MRILKSKNLNTLPSVVCLFENSDYDLNEAMQIIDLVNYKDEYPDQQHYKKDFVDVEVNNTEEFKKEMERIGWKIEE